MKLEKEGAVGAGRPRVDDTASTVAYQTPKRMRAPPAAAVIAVSAKMASC